MKSLEEVRKEVVAMCEGLTNEQGKQSMQEIIETIGLEEFKEDIIDMSMMMDEKAQVSTITNLLSGDFDAAAIAGMNAVFMGFVMGYRLGCSHTAERMDT